MEAPDGYSFSDNGPRKDRIIRPEKDRPQGNANELGQMFKKVSRL